MKDNSPVALGKFQLKLLKTIEAHNFELTVFFLSVLLISILIAVISFIYYSKQKKTVLKKYPAITFSIGGVMFALSVYLYYGLEKVIIQGFDFEAAVPVLLMFCGYFFTVYIALEQFILWRRGPYFKNIRNNSLLLGVRQGDFGEAVINPQFLYFDPKSLFGDFHVIGGKGSGKTTTFVIPPLQQILCDTTETRPSVFLVDAKGVLSDMIDAMAHPRREDIMIIGQNGISGNLLDMSDPLLTANNLSLAFSNFQGGNVNEFFKNYQETFLRNSIQFLDYFVKRDRRYDFFDKSNPGHIYLEESKFFNFRAVTIVEVYNWMSEFELKKNLLKYVSESRNTEGYFSSKIFELARYFEKTLRDDEGHLSGMISMISPLISEKTRNFFASPEPFDFVDAINKGKIIIVNVPEGGFGTISKLIGLVLLLQMQKTSLKRLDSNFKINRSRFIFIILDEVQKFMCSELANFPSVSRQAKVCNMYLHQSLGQIPEQYIDDLYGNTLNKVILYVRDNRTAEYVSQNFGEKTVLKETTNESKQGGTVRQGQVFAGSIKSMGKSFREEKERRFTAHDIVHLKRNRAIISMSDGSNILESFMVDLLPFYMNDIFPVYHFIFKFDKPLEKQTIAKMKAVLENTARNVNAEFKRFSNGDNAVYFMFAFRKPVDRKFVDTVYSGIKGGLTKYGSTAGELFQGDLDTVIDKKAEAGII